jgi:hypothetical protein
MFKVTIEVYPGQQGRTSALLAACKVLLDSGVGDYGAARVVCRRGQADHLPAPRHSQAFELSVFRNPKLLLLQISFK